FMATTPNLGYGQRGEVPIDAYNQWQRSQPWYRTLIQSFGQDLNNVHLNDNQKQQVIRAAQANGVVVDEGHNGQEVDDSGNFQAKSHALRNTLIVAGIAGAALLTAGAAGAFSGAAGAGAGAGGASTATAAGAGTGIAGAGAGAAGAAGVGAAGAGAAAAGGLTYADLLRYVVPTAGGVIGGIIQANAAGSASEAQQKYLEEALAYAKEKDAYDRTRQEGLDTQERERYGGYQGRIAPFIASGTSANARMAGLLGLSPTVSAPSSDSYSGRTSTVGAPPAQQQGVLMVGPDGSQRRVPPERVDEAKKLGAQLVGAA
ncbi:MAG: hypothetical protein V4537_14660, partial [Pseudomonadota bacterium]